MSLRDPFRVKTAVVLLALLAGFAAPASAVISEFSVLMNTDVSPVTGCDVTTVDGVFPGVEHILITTVDTTGASSAQVIRIERQVCVNPGTDTFGPRILVDETDRPVGVGLGIDGFNVVETYFPLSVLPPGPPNGPGVVRFGVTSLNSTGGQDALLTVSPAGNQPIQLILAALSPTNVPTLSEWGLILLGLLLASAALVILRRRSATALLAALVLFTGAGIAWAAASDLNGNTLGEWGSPLANDTAGDAPVGADIRAFFAMEDGPTNRVYFRLDVSLEFNTSAVATNDAATVTEDAAATAIDVLANDSDAEGDPFTITAVTQPANGTVVITGGGTGLTYQPNLNYCNNPPGTTLDTFTYTITGGDTATVSVTVNCVDDLPVANDDAATVMENAAATAVNVLANDTDAEGDPFTITAVTQPTNGTVVITGGGTGLTYQPNPGYCNTPPGTTLDTFTYTITGGDTANVTMTVTCTDDPPTAVADSATVAEDSGANAINVLANDTDPDGGPISITSVTQPSNGTVVITGGGTGLTYAPNADYCNNPPGTTLDTFTYTLTPSGPTPTATVTVTVTCADDPPTAVADSATVAEDSGANAIDVLANDTDPDGGPISIDSVTQPTNGTVVITGGGTGLTYAPNADYCNNPPGTTLDTFTYTLTPGGSFTTVTVTVTCEDDPPVAVNDTATVNEDSGANTINVQANDTDPDGGTNTITAVTQPANGTVVITNGGADLTYTPNANYCNNPPGTTLETFTYTLTPSGPTPTATVTVTVNCVDDPPVAVADAATVNEDSGANTINVLANDTDIDAGPISVGAVTQPANGSVVITNGGADLTYTPNANYCNNPPGTALDTFNYSLNPGGSTTTVTVTVTCLNDGPVIDLDANDDKGTAGSDFAVTFTEGEAAKLIEDPADATVTDVDSATLASLTVTITNLFDTGFETLAADTTGTSITANYATVAGAPGTGTLTLTGPDTVANFQQVLRTITYVNTDTSPNATPRVIQFVANDGTTNGNTAVSTVTVVSVDTEPTAVNDAATVNEDSGATAIDVLANDTDPDGGPISITSVTQPTGGTVVITGGGTGLTFQPDANFCTPGSPVTFTYTLTPGGSTATVSVTVTCIDDNPVAVADSATVAEDSGATTINVLANDTDPDGGPISIQSVTQPAGGTVVITNGGADLTYQPNANFCTPGSPDTFTYTLTPGGSFTTVSVTVTCVDDNPVAVADAATVVEDSVGNVINVLTNDTDVDGGPISIQSVTQPANGSVTNNTTNVTYTPNANYCNNPPGTTLETFTYTLTPGGSSTTVTVTVTCVDDPPVAVNDSATVLEDAAATSIPVLANDTDPDAGPISITAVTQPTNGTVVITGGGTGLTYQPNANYCNNPPGTTLETFTYTLTPGGSVATVTVTVTCVNDAPVADPDAFDFIGNTDLVVDLAALPTPHALETTPSTLGVVDGDSDPVENNAISVTAITVGACTDASAPLDCSDPAVGRVQMQSNGRFIFTPAAGDAGATETFQYTLTDNGVPAPASAIGTVTLTRFERVWYVKNDAPAGGNGTSSAPFNSITPANLSDNDGDGDLTDDLDSAGDYIFVYFGTGTTANQAGGLVLENNQHLIGQHAGLSLNVNLNGNGAPTNLVAAAAGSRPLLDDTVVDAFEGVSARNVVPAEIVGMNLAGNVNAIDWTTTAAFAGTGTFSIRDNVIRSAAGDGVDMNLAGTSIVNLAFHDNNLTATGSALDIQETGTGSLTITAFDDNVVSGNTGGSGIVISNAIFDSVPGGGLNTVDGGTTVIGASGNGVGGAGMALGNVQGDLHFTGNLNIFADAGAGLTVSGTGAGMQLRVNSGGAPTGIIQATGGPAVDATATALDLRLTSLTSTNSTSTGVSLTNVTGTFSAESGSSITNTTGTDFVISGGTAGVTYKGTITDDVGQLVSVSGATGGIKSFEGAITDGDDGDGGGISLSGNTGATINFSGGVTLSTGGNSAFAATGGGTVNVTGSTNKLTTTTATALNVASTTIGSSGVTFRSISVDGNDTTPTNGIVLSNTGSSGGLTVTGTGSAGSGGTIQDTSGDGISLVNTRNVSLSWMSITSNLGSGIFGDDITNFSLISGNVTNNTDVTGGAEAGLRFNELLGNCAITNSTISNNFYDNVRLTPASGVLSNLAISGSTIGPNDGTVGNNGLTFIASGSATATINVSGTTFNDNRASHFLGQNNGSGLVTLSVSSNNFNNGNIAVDLLHAQSGDVNFTINGNTIVGADSNAINFSAASTSTNNGDVVGTISNNIIGNAAVVDSGSRDAFGIAIDAIGDVDMVLAITNNVIRHTDFEGIFVESAFDDTDADAETALLDLTLRDNDVGTPDDNSAFPFGTMHGVRVEARHTSRLCLDIAGNNASSVGGVEHFRVRQRNTATFTMERLTDGDGTPNEVITNMATVESFVAGQNDAGSTVDATNQTAGVTGFTEAANGSCRNP